MKKLFFVCLILVISITSVFALDSYIGGYVDYMFETGQRKGTFLLPFEYSISKSSIGFGVTGTEYFTDSFGLSYKVCGAMLVSNTEADIKQDISKEPLVFNTALDFLYRYKFSKIFALEAGGGLSYSMTTDADSGLSYTVHTLDIDLKVGMLATIKKDFALSAGVNMATPVLTKPIFSSDTGKATYDLSVTSFKIGPYVALLYKFWFWRLSFYIYNF